MASQDPTAQLHDEAVQAEKHLEALATGLAQVGASDQTVKAVTQMAEVTRQIVSALGQHQEEPAQEAPAEEHQPGSMHEAAAQTHQMMQQAAAKRQ